MSSMQRLGNWIVAFCCCLIISCSSATEPELIPSPVTDLRLVLGRSNSAIMSWTSPERIQDSEQITYDFRYSNMAMSSSEDWNSAIRITDLSSPADAGIVESYTINGLKANRNYYAAMRVLGENGKLSEFSSQIRIITSDTSMPLAFSAPDLYGDPHTSSEWQGKRLVLINFWGAWCYWCRVEMPDLIKIHDDFADEGLVIVGFNRGDLVETARDYAEQLKIPWLNVVIPGEVVEDYEVHAYPTSVFLDSSGMQLGRLRGAQSYDEFASAIRYLLNNTSSISGNLIETQVREDIND